MPGGEGEGEWTCEHCHTHHYHCVECGKEAFGGDGDELCHSCFHTPTPDAYDAACRALHHWRAEAKRLADLLGVKPRQMDHR